MKAEKKTSRESAVVGFLHQSGDAMEEGAIDLSGMSAVKIAGEQALSISSGDGGAVVVVGAWPHFVS
jgi:hypothetical protein